MRWIIYINTDGKKQDIIPNLTGPVTTFDGWNNFTATKEFHPYTFDFVGIVTSVEPMQQTIASNN